MDKKYLVEVYRYFYAETIPEPANEDELLVTYEKCLKIDSLRKKRNLPIFSFSNLERVLFEFTPSERV